MVLSLGLTNCFGSSTSALTGSTTGTTEASPSSPPVDIPSPVSHLSISSPDADGLVRVVGAAGFADAGSTVTVTSTQATSSLIKNSVRKGALQATTSATGTVNADGSFSVSLTSGVGDTITVTFTLESTLSQTDANVPDNKPLIPEGVSLFDVSVDGDLAQAGVLGNDGVDGFLYILDVNAASISNTITLTGATDAFRVSLDPTTGYYYVIDNVNAKFWEVSPDSGVVDSVTVTAPLDVVAGESGNFAVFTHGSGTSPASYFDVLTNTATVLPAPTYPAEATHVETPYVDAQSSEFYDCVATVSEMSDGIFYVYKYMIYDSLSSYYSGEITLSGTEIGTVTTPGGIALFNAGEEVLVTDSDNNRVLRAAFMDATAFTEIAVGEFPTGVTVDDANNLAYVVNSLDDTVSVIDLNTNTEIDTVETGILPLEISVDSTGSFFTAVAVSSFDNTVTIIEN